MTPTAAILRDGEGGPQYRVLNAVKAHVQEIYETVKIRAKLPTVALALTRALHYHTYLIHLVLFTSYHYSMVEPQHG